MEKFGCNWCFGTYPEVKLVQVRAGRNEWQHPIYMCADCRKQLIGQFRYVKEKTNEKSNR